MITEISCTKFKPLLFSSLINPSAHSPISFFSSSGRYSLFTAGAVVTKDVRDYALIVEAPWRQKSWMSRLGHVLKSDHDGIMTCPESGLRYKATAPAFLACLYLDEGVSLTEILARGRIDESMSRVFSFNKQK